MLLRFALIAVFSLILSACSSSNTSSSSPDVQADQAQDNDSLEQEITTASGLRYVVLESGQGEHPRVDSVVTVDYVGSLENGDVFDSTYVRGQASTFALANTIEGFREGLSLMTPGSRYRFIIPPELAYGSEGRGDLIGPNEVLIFEVVLLEINS